jgi:hypothetical protein
MKPPIKEAMARITTLTESMRVNMRVRTTLTPNIATATRPWDCHENAIRETGHGHSAARKVGHLGFDVLGRWVTVKERGDNDEGQAREQW